MRSFARGLGGTGFVMSAMAAMTAACAAPTSGAVEAEGTTSQAISVQASFDAVLKIPRCSGAASSCDSGTLLTGRGTMTNGHEPNASNALGGCLDGAYGSFHSDESIDHVRVSTVDGLAFAPGKAVTITADVWVWAGSADTALLYYTADATAPSPTWTLVRSQLMGLAGAQSIVANYTLPALPANGSTTQAVRVQFVYGSASSACQAGGYNDRDDVAFSVGVAGPPDTTTPVVAITSPAAGARVTGTVAITANATDNVGVARVEYWLLPSTGAAALVGTATAAPFGLSWDSTKSANGNYTLEARAFDAAGNRGIADTALSVANGSTVAMSTGHSPASTAALAGGRILITGNSTSYPWTASTEEYDSASGAFVAPTAMNEGRVGERLTAMSDGTVLATGGWGNPLSSTRSLASAEVYDPTRHTWAEGPPMSTPRYGHTATRLGDGSVLVTGGVPDPSGTTMSSAELYIPIANAWTATAPLPVSLVYHSAALLPTGKVLVVGGQTSTSQGFLMNATAYLYDPAARAWSVLSTSNGVGSIVASLPNGDVLIASGSQSHFYKADGTFSAWVTIPVAPGWSCFDQAFVAHVSGDVLSTGCGPTVSRLSASTGTWSTLAALPNARTDAALAMSSGTNKLLVIGGKSFSCSGSGCGQGAFLPSADVVDLSLFP